MTLIFLNVNLKEYLKIMEKNKIYLGDANELIKHIEDKSIDLIYVDAPYLNVGGDGGAFDNRAIRQQLRDPKLNDGFNYDLLNEFDRVMKKINLYIWLSRDQIFKVWEHYEKLNCLVTILVLCKTNPIPQLNNTYLSDLEYCLFIRQKGVKLAGTYETKSKFYLMKTNVDDKKEFKHPTIKPLEFVKNHIINSCPLGGVVLDCFLGSGTTAVAAKQTGRNYIGFEIDEKYYNIALDRLKGINANGQINLFDADFEQLQLEFEKNKK